MAEKILIAYYSWSGNTREVAQKIHEITGGTLLEIIPQVPYLGDYNMTVNQAKQEIKNGFRPTIELTVENIGAYSNIFAGSPNWWNTIAPPVATFLNQYDFTGKTILPFCTHGGGGQGNIKNHITRLCPDSLVLECFEIYGSRSDIEPDKLIDWLKRTGILKEYSQEGRK